MRDFYHYLSFYFHSLHVESASFVVVNPNLYLKYIEKGAAGLTNGSSWKNAPGNLQEMIFRQVKRGDKISMETRYYLSSLVDTADTFNGFVRKYWSIENRLRRTRDPGRRCVPVANFGTLLIVISDALLVTAYKVKRAVSLT